MHKLKGDTLIEVALAIGIFSMVAVSVVAVVSGSTSSAQSALELTVTREEIDAQAEALRFIQSSYLMGGMSNIAGFTQEKYSLIWKEITSHAIDIKNQDNDPVANAVLNYNPDTCQELYEYKENNYNYIKDSNQKAFIINTRNLGATDTTYQNYKDGSGPETFIKEQVVLSADRLLADGTPIFQPSLTYPRILFNGDNGDALYNDISRDGIANIEKVEGLFIVAVKDSGSLVVRPNDISTDTPAYYDFYIRSCWYNPGADRPSTISTVIRLQDPAVILYE